MNLTKQILAFTKNPHKRAFMLATSLFLSPDKSIDFAASVRKSYATLLAQAERGYQKDVRAKVAEYKKYLASLLQEADRMTIKKKGQ